MTDDDFRRLENKVDRLTDAVLRLVVIEERQTSQGERIGRVEMAVTRLDTEVAANEKTLAMWINRGIGVWVAFAALVALLEFGARFLK